MHRFLAALRFLTIVPIPGSLGHSQDSLAGSLVFFPVVGLGIGLGAAFFAWGSWLWLAPLPASFVTVALLLIVSGGLHLDGLCDTADGFFSARPREQVLAIMRDSRVGAMGVMALILLIGIKTSALAVQSRDTVWPVVLLMPLVGRVSLLVLMALLPYVRKEGGLATLFYRSSSRLAACLGVCGAAGVAWWVAGLAGLLALGGVLLVLFGFAFYCRAKIGGATGDTLGAGCEIAETLIALFLALQPLMALQGS